MTQDSALAYFGGPKAIVSPFKKYNAIGEEERLAVDAVMRTGNLSSFIGGWGSDFWGGPKVQEFEARWAEYFGVKHAISVNSWTSGLVCALGATGIAPGDEVIVTPWTMCATATAIMHWNAIPVFADIEPHTFNIDPACIVEKISHRTKAIVAADIFGHSCDINALLEIAKTYGLKLITDSAQSPGAVYRDRYAGTMADIGGFSLNYHKHIHTGEGGMLVTNDSELCLRMQLIRNHAEAAVGAIPGHTLVNMIGHNFRMGEIEASIGIEQLKKLEVFANSRQDAAQLITRRLKNLPGLNLPVVQNGCTHVYYIYPMVLDIDSLGVTREIIVKALEAEGLSGLMNGYANIHKLPMYQNKIAYGSNGFPWSLSENSFDYGSGSCPVAEKLHESQFLGFEMCLYQMDAIEVDLFCSAFEKVWDSLSLLSAHHVSVDSSV